MGTCKEELTPKNDQSKSFFGLIASKKKSPSKADGAQTFADLLAEADKRLDLLVATKEGELKSEKGQEDYNRKALSYIRTMRFHLDEVINAAADYGTLK